VLLPVAAYAAPYLLLWAALLVGIVSASFGVDDLIFGEDWGIGVALIAIIALATVLVVAYVQYRFASALVLRISGAREVKRDQEPALWRTVENLCIGAGLPQPRVYVVESMAANAFATGLSPERASIAVTRGLLALLERHELEGVIAHELSHIGNHDTRIGTVLAAGVGMLRLPFAIVVTLVRLPFRLHWLVGAGILFYLGVPFLLSIPFGISEALELLESEPLAGALMLGGMLVPIYILFGAPSLGLLIRVAIMREREFLADADAVLLARHAEGLATALTKMSTAAGPPLKVGGATAHLYIVDPLPGDAPWWDRIFSTHPPAGERIAALAEMGGGITPSVLRAAEEAGTRFRSEQGPVAVAGTIASGDSAPMRDTAPGEVRRSPVAFRLTGDGATLYAGADTASTPLARLEAGALITVMETKGAFLQVLTVDDSFGYISSSAPMTEVDLDEPAT
jgi:heat shock protein HtpX